MGEGGYIGLINGTSYAWKRTGQSQYQMVNWDFPQEIQPGAAQTVYVEFDQGFRKHRGDTQGSCTFVLAGTDCKFHIQIRDAPSSITVKLENISTPNNAHGSLIDLGWQHDGIKYFVLSGKQGSFASSNPPVDWMQQNLRTLGHRAIAQVCMPGTHDAGMGQITWSDHIPTDIISIFTQTQSRDVYGQLICGSRYFDIRPEISGGTTWTGHYDGKLGARGQSMSSIIEQVNRFTRFYQELVIINLSHAKNTDENFRDYNQTEWNGVMQELLALEDRYIVHANHQHGDDLSLLPLNQFIGNNRAAVLVVVEAPSSITLGLYATQGFYRPQQLNVRNEYSDSDDAVYMVQHQLDKLEKHAPGGDKRLFLISWTLTQQKPSIDNLVVLLAQLSKFKSIRDLAYSANKALFTTLFPRVNDKAFPNIVYVDFMESNDHAALAMAVNHKCFS